MPKLKGVLLDTNACLYLLQRRVDSSVEIETGIVSVVTEVELLGYPEITKADEGVILEFLSLFEMVPIDEAVRKAAIRLRRKYRLRLGDALICGTAEARGVTLVSHDKDLQKIKELKVVDLPLIA